MMFQYNGYYFEITPNPHNPFALNGECKEINYFYLGSSYDSAISGFKTKVDGILTKKEKETTVDKDVIRVDEFLSSLDGVQKQMSRITDHKYKDMILDVKLRRMYDWYGDKLELKSFDNLKDFYLRRQIK